MERTELLKVYTLAKTLWRNFRLPESEVEASVHDEVWYGLLKDYNYKLIELAMVNYSKKSDFCNIGKITEECNKILQARDGYQSAITEESVFRELVEAINYSPTLEEIEERDGIMKPGESLQLGFEKLSDVAKRVVVNVQGLRELGLIESQTFHTVTKSNIMRVARNLLQKKEYVELYNDIKQLPNSEAILLENKKTEE